MDVYGCSRCSQWNHVICHCVCDLVASDAVLESDACPEVEINDWWCWLHESCLQGRQLLNVGMPTWHPHPKNPSWPLPLAPCLSCLGFIDPSLGFSYKAFAALPVACSFAHVMRSWSWGAWSKETMAPLPSPSQLSFWGLGKRRLALWLPSQSGRLCPPIPLHRTLKEGHGGGWGEVRRMKNVGILGRGRSPIPRRSLPIVHTRTRRVMWSKMPIYMGILAQELWAAAPREKGSRSQTSE